MSAPRPLAVALALVLLVQALFVARDVSFGVVGRGSLETTSGAEASAAVVVA